jgi:hypothetical protein
LRAAVLRAKSSFTRLFFTPSSTDLIDARGITAKFTRLKNCRAEKWQISAEEEDRVERGRRLTKNIPGQREPMPDGHRRRCGGGQTATDGNIEEIGQLLNGWGSSPRLLQLEAG